MFSTAQQAYIDALLPTYAKDGYKYYVIYSNYMANSGYGSSTNPDLYALFSKKAISAKDAYSFDIKDSSILVTVRSGNYSSSSSANNGSRVVVKNFSPGTLSIPQCEHIYTNAEFSGYTLQPDYYLQSGGETNVQLQGYTFLMLIVCCFVILNSLWFRRR